MANKQWTAEDIEKIWNSTNNTAQATPQPAPIPVLKSKLDYEVKPYENKTYTASDVEKIWKNVERGKEVQAEMKAKANDTTPARFNKVPSKEELSRRNLAEGLDSASKSLNKDLKSIDRRNLTREEEAKLKKQEKEEKTARQAKVKQLNDVSKNMGDTNADRYNSRLSLNKPINNNKVNDPISVSYNQANKKEETSEIKQNLDKEVGNYFNTKDKTRENMLNNRKNEERFIKHMARSYGYSREDVKDYLKDYKNQALMSDYLVSRDRYDQLMQDGRLRNDLEPLAMALANGSNAKNVGRYNIQSMGYNNVDDYIDQLSKRYELTSDEIKDMVKTYNSDREKAQAEKLSQGMYELGNNKGAMGKVMGTLMPLTYKGAAGVEGWYNTLANLTTGDDRNQSHIFNAMANASQQGVADSMDSQLAKNIYNFGVGGASAALNAAAGPMGIAAQSGNAANEAMNSAIERGINPLAAGVYGGFAGGSDYLFNRVGFNAIEKSIGQQSITNAKGVVLKALTNFGIEGAENVAQDAVQSVADVILHGDNSELNNAYAEYIESGLSPEDAFANVAVDYAKQLGGSFVQGGIGGAIFGGIKGDYRYDDGSSLANRAVATLNRKKTEARSSTVQARVKASEIEDVKQDIEKFSNAAQEATATGDVQTAEALAQTVERLNTKLADLEGETIAEVPRVGKQPSLLAEDNVTGAESATMAESAPRSYKDLLPENPFYETDSYKQLENERAEIENQISDLEATRKELYNRLDNETISKKAKEEMTPDEYITSMFFLEPKPTNYTEEGNRIKESIRGVNEQIDNLNNRHREILDTEKEIKNGTRVEQLQNYQFTEPQPATQNEYEGFDITKATNTGMQEALDSGKATIVEMSPLEYLQRSTYDIEDEATLESVIETANGINKVHDYADAMRNGDKFPILDLTYEGKSGRGQEGRTRALAAYEAGIDKVPVAIVGKPSENPNNARFISNYEFNKRMSENPLTDEDINNALMNMSDEELREAAGVPRVGKSPSLLAETPTQAELNTQALQENTEQTIDEAIQRNEVSSKRKNDAELDDMINDIYKRANNLDNDEVYTDEFKNLYKLTQLMDQIEGSDAYLDGRQSTQLSMDNVPFDTIRAEDGTHLLDATNNLGLSTVNIDDIDKLTDYFKSEYNRLSTPAEVPAETPKATTPRKRFFEVVKAKGLQNNIKFDNEADNEVYQAARKDILNKYQKFAANPTEETWNAVYDSWYALKEAASKGYELESTAKEYQKQKKEFADRTKGMKIRLSDTDMAELTDLRYKDINKILSTFGNNTGIKVRKDIGIPIDSVWSDLVEASGGRLDPNLTNTQDMARALVDYARDIADKVNNPTTERIPADIEQYIGEEFFNNVNAIMEEVMKPKTTSSIETPNRVMAEDIGLNPETRLDDEPNVIEEELEPRNPYRKDGVSQFATNTMINTKVFDADTVENNPTIKDMAKLVKEGHTDVDTFNGAMERVTSDGDKWMNDIIDGKYVLGADKDKADLDFDTGMVLLTGLRDAIDSSTDPAEIAALTAKRDLLYGKMQTFSTSAARTLHAHKKWNSTAEGLTMAGNQLLGDQADVWSTRNKNEVEKNQKVADDLSKIGKKNKKEKLPINKKLNTAIKDLSAVKKPNDDGTEKTHEQLVQEIENTLKKHNMYDQYKDRIDVLANYVENIPTWQLTDQLRHFAQTGEFYTVDESTPLAREKSSKLVRAFKEQGDKTPKAEKEEIGFAKRKQRVINTLEDELGSIEGTFTDDAINQLVDFEEKLPTWQLIDEIEHYLEHGEFYPITEDVPQNLPKMGALTNMLDRIVSDGSMQKTAKEPDTFEQTLEKVRNTFEDENSGFAGQFNDNDFYFIATMFQEKVPKWQIEDELRYKMETGNWYSIDESIREPRVQNQKLKNAIKTRSEGEKVPVEKEPLTFEELQEQVKNTFLANRLENMTDDDVDYIAGMMQAGATTKEIAQALNMKAATGRFGMSTEAQNEISRLYKYMDKLDPESKEYVEAQMEAFRIAANEVKSSASAVEKFDAWRYLAMLGNPKTMVRNLVGNTMFNVVTGFSNNVAAMGESALRLKNRTKAVLNPVKDRDLMKATKADFNNKRYASGAGDKYHSYQKGIEGATSAFDSHVMQFLEDLTNRGISDTRFVRAKYGTSLAGYMKANGLTQKDLEDSYKYDGLRKLQRNKNRLMTKEELAELERTKPIAEKMEKARDYALEQAKYATFHEDNAFADKLSQHINDWKKGEIKKKDGTVVNSKVAKAAGYALDGILPFRKTPANILKSGIEYSPLGVIKSTGDTLKLVYENTGKRKNYADTYYNRKGELVHKTIANDVIEDWSKNLTGSLMSMLGYYLFSKGILKDSDKDTKYQDSLEGLQNYSIEINGKTYTVDWAAPACMPLLLGAEVAKIHRDNGISDKKFYDDPERYWEVANRMVDPLVETSMLQGVKDTLETAANAAKYNEELSVPTLLAYNALTGYATQAIPTLSGQVSRFIDPTRRSTYTEREGVSGIIEKQVRKTMNKTPLSRLNQPYYDTYGRTQSNNPFEYSERFADEPLKNIGRGIGNALYQFASPSYIQNVNTTDADAMTREVYEAIKKDDEEAAKVFGQWQSVKKIDGQRVSDEDYAKFAQKRGETDYEIRDALAHDEWFKMLDNDEKAKILKSITGVANKVGEAEINPNFKTDDANYKAFSEGGVNALLDEYKDSVHNNRVKNELGTTSDFAKELYDSGDQKRLDLYKQGNAIAEQYGYDSLSEEEFLNYEKYGEAKLNKILNYKATAKELGVNNNDTFKKLVDSGVSKDSIKQASDAITSVQFGKDEFGRDQYLPFSQETYDVYKSHGTAGLKDYAKIKQGKANYKTYYQAQKALPTLIKNADSYVKMFNALDGKAGSKANGEISQDELFQYFNGRDMTQAQVNAYWNAFGKISGDDAWKSVPVLKYNKKAGKNIWQAESKSKKK